MESMTQQMYLYFDENGNINKISPESDSSLNDMFKHILVPLAEVEPILTGKSNPLGFTIKKIKTKGSTEYKLIKKTTEVNYTRTLDNYLMKISQEKTGSNVILMINDTRQKVLSVTIAREFKALYTHGTDDQIEMISDFLGSGATAIHITKRNDPYSLFFSIIFSPAELFHKETLYFNYDGECKNTSAYAKRIIAGYSYKEI